LKKIKHFKKILKRKMNSDEEDDIVQPERLPIYRKGKEIFDMVNKITDLIPENDEYLNEVKACMLSDAAQLTVTVAGAEAGELTGGGSLILRILVHSTKTPMMTYRFVVLKKLLRNEKMCFF
jgi:hypothetical protein